MELVPVSFSSKVCMEAADVLECGLQAEAEGAGSISALSPRVPTLLPTHSGRVAHTQLGACLNNFPFAARMIFQKFKAGYFPN